METYESLCSELKAAYEQIVSSIDTDVFGIPEAEDKYSAVFLPMPSPTYLESSPKIMLVGRETAGWNKIKHGETFNKLSAVTEAINSSDLPSLVELATKKHLLHLELNPKTGKPLKTKSHFKNYYTKLSREFSNLPADTIYSNLIAWDYKKSTILNRCAKENDEITRVSLELLAAQIKILKPQFIVFACGSLAKTDPLIKRLFKDHFSAHETEKLNHVPGKIWEFSAAETTCFRIAHPRANSNEHPFYRNEVIKRIKARI